MELIGAEWSGENSRVNMNGVVLSGVEWSGVESRGVEWSCVKLR